jgi:hypothetical protein
MPGGSAVADVASFGRRARIESERVDGPGHKDLSAEVAAGLLPPLVFSATRGLTAFEVCCHHGNALEIVGAPGSQPRLLDNWADGIDPGSQTAGWSPTGDLIAYARVSAMQSINGLNTPEWKLAVIAPNGKRHRILTPDIASPYVPPVFSPDGRSILFCADGPQPGMYTVPAAGGPVDQMTRGDCDGNVFVWSPDGREIAYIGAARGTVSGRLEQSVPSAVAVGDEPSPLVLVAAVLRATHERSASPAHSALREGLARGEAFGAKHRLDQGSVGAPPV